MSLRFGEWTVRSVEAGHCWLDGGAMFGSVPKTLWEREHEADDRNRIDLALRCLLLEGHGRKVLIDTGAGDKWSEKLRAIYRIEGPPSALAVGLESIGVAPEEITDVVLTHFHFDHAGGVSWQDDDGRTRLTFPDARHWVQEENLRNARRPHLREKASYLPENVEPVVEGGRAELLSGDAEILPGLSVRVVNGHTRGMQVVRLAGPEGGLLYAADLVPTRSHLRLPYTMGYDIHPGLLVDEKAEVLQDCLDAELLVVFEHDPLHAAARLELREGRIEAADFVEI